MQSAVGSSPQFISRGGSIAHVLKNLDQGMRVFKIHLVWSQLTSGNWFTNENTNCWEASICFLYYKHCCRALVAAPDYFPSDCKLGEFSLTLPCFLVLLEYFWRGLCRTNTGRVEISFECWRAANLLDRGANSFGGYCSSSGVPEVDKQGCFFCVILAERPSPVLWCLYSFVGTTDWWIHSRGWFHQGSARFISKLDPRLSKKFRPNEREEARSRVSIVWPNGQFFASASSANITTCKFAKWDWWAIFEDFWFHGQRVLDKWAVHGQDKLQKLSIDSRQGWNWCWEE